MKPYSKQKNEPINNKIYENLEWAKEDPFFILTAEELKEGFEKNSIPVQVLF